MVTGTSGDVNSAVPITALLVEDDPDSRELLRRILGAAQINVTIVGDAEEALKILEDFHPDLLIVDLALPGMNGYQFLERVRQDPRLAHTPAIAVTAFAREFQPESAKAANLI